MSAPQTRREPLATPQEVASYLRRSTKTLRNWRALGEGPRFTGSGSGVRYLWTDVEAFVRARTTKTAS